MKTILVNHMLEPPNRISGITRYLFSLLSELTKRRNFRYILMTTWSAWDLPPQVTSGGLEVETRPFHPSTPRNILSQLKSVPELFNASGAVAEFNSNPLGCFLPTWPRVIAVHDLYMRTLPNQYFMRHRLWWNILFPAVAWSANEIICVSHVTQDDVLKHYPWLTGKTVVVHEAGALECTDDIQSSSRYPHGLFVGNISPNKNVGLLLEALSILERRGHQMPVHIAGSDGAGLLAAEVAKHKLRNPPHLLGAVSDRELSNAYAGARFLVSTSRQEGFCLPVIEAHERGVPVVCPDLPIFREVAGAGALYFPSGNSEALADTLHQLMNNEALRSSISQAASNNAKRFSWSSAAEQTEIVLERAISGYRA